MNNKLTPERLFSEPALRLEQPSQYKISPCANYVSFLRANAQRSRQLDLWLLDRASQQERCLLNAAAVTDERDDDVTKLSRRSVRIENAVGSLLKASPSISGVRTLTRWSPA